MRFITCSSLMPNRPTPIRQTDQPPPPTFTSWQIEKSKLKQHNDKCKSFHRLALANPYKSKFNYFELTQSVCFSFSFLFWQLCKRIGFPAILTEYFYVLPNNKNCFHNDTKQTRIIVFNLLIHIHTNVYWMCKFLVINRFGLFISEIKVNQSINWTFLTPLWWVEGKVVSWN